MLSTQNDNKNLTGSKANKLILILFFVYFASMASKGMLSSGLLVFRNQFGVLKSEASMISTYYYITYTLGQILVIPLFKRIDVKKFLIVTVSISSVLTLLSSFSTKIWHMYVIWCANGLFQAGIWGGSISVLSAVLAPEKYSHVTKMMSTAYSFSGAVPPLMVSLSIIVDMWYLPYLITGALLLVMIVLFVIFYIKHLRENKVSVAKKEKFVANELVTEKYLVLDTKLKKVFFFAVIGICVFIAYLLQSGTTKWLPDLLNEVYHLDEALSVFLTTFIPVVVFVGPIIVMSICDKVKNYLSVIAITMCMSLGFYFLTYLLFDKSWILFLILVFMCRVTLNGVRAYLVGSIPFKLKEQMDPGVLSTVLNVFASLSASSSTILVFLMEVLELDWGGYFFMIFLIALFVTLLIVFSAILLTASKNKRDKVKQTVIE